MENAMLAKELRDKSLLKKKIETMDAEKVMKAKLAYEKVRTAGKAPVVVAAVAEVKKPEKPEPPKSPEPGSVQPPKPAPGAPPHKGIFVGLDTKNKPFFKIIGEPTDLEYLGLMRYAELQFQTTLDLFVPTSNLKIVKMLEEMKVSSSK